jgi:GntR family transcriptional regulator
LGRTSTQRGALDPDANTWFWETRLTRDGEPVALVQEHIPAGRDLRSVSPLLAERCGTRRIRAAPSAP